MYNVMRATVDEFLIIQKGNQEFFHFVGPKIQSSLYKSVFKEDVKKLQDIVSFLPTSLQEDVVLRLLSTDSGYRWVTLHLQYIPNNGDSTIEISFTDVLELTNSLAEMNNQIKVYCHLLSLADQICFQYSFLTGIITVFWINHTQEITLFRDDLREWHDKCIAEEYVKDIDTFDFLCNDIRSGKRAFSIELTSSMLSRGGNEECYLFSGLTMFDGVKKTTVVGTITPVDPISKEKKDTSIVEFCRDPLTGLLNKKEISKRAESSILPSTSTKTAFVILDIDNFKYINDTYGHMFGDDVLVVVSNILEYNIRGRGFVGRMGGDEFFMVIEDVTDDMDIRSILRAIRSSIAEAYRSQFKNFALSCSIGISVYPNDGQTYDELFKKADRALYIAKERGKNRYIIYKEHLHGKMKISTSDGNMIDINRDLGSLAAVESINSKLSLLYNEGIEAIPKVLAMIGEQYNLFVIRIYYGADNEVLYLWGDGRKEPITPEYIHNNDYTSGFNSNNMLIVDHIDHLELRFAKLYANYKHKGVYRYIHGLIGTKDNVKGLISFAQGESKRNSLWSDNEYKELAIITNAISNILIKAKG